MYPANKFGLKIQQDLVKPILLQSSAQVVEILMASQQANFCRQTGVRGNLLIMAPTGLFSR
jgi:hypothetical protein